MHSRLDHDQLHDMAAAKFGKGMGDLDIAEFRELHQDVMRRFPVRPKTKDQRPKTKRQWSDPASAAQIRYIGDLREKVPGMEDDATFNMWMARSLGVFKKAPEFANLKNGEAYKVIEGLKALGSRL